MKIVLHTTYKSLNQLSKRMARGLEGLSALLIFICFLTLLFQVLYRFVIVKFFSFSFPFTEEFARYLLVWTVYLIAGVNLRDGSMVSVNFIYDRLGIKGKMVLYYFTRAMVILFLSVTFFYALQVVHQNFGYRSSTLRIPGWFLFLAPVAGVILMSFETIVEVCGVLSGDIEPFGKRMESNEE